MTSSYPEQSKATTVLVLGILGVVICGLLAPVAWILGNEELRAIAEGRRPPENHGTANAGRILGIVGSVLLAVALVIVFGFGVGV